MDNETMQNFLLAAVAAAVDAGYRILDIYDTDFTVEHKADSSPLTLADRQSHDIIVDELQDTQIPILSEEGKSLSYEDRKRWKRLWIIDPLDGTKEFIKRNGEFTVNIALVDDHRPVLGVIYVPVKRTLYFGAVGRGSYKVNDAASSMPEDVEAMIRTAQKLPIENRSERSRPGERPYTIIGSRSHATPELTAFVEEKRKIYGNVDFISAGSSLKICRVAEGSADIYPRLGPTMEWDTAAGQAIAENAGRKVLVWDTQKPLRYNREDLLNPWFVVR